MKLYNIIKSNSGSGLQYIVADVKPDGSIVCLDANLDGRPCATETSSGRRYRTTTIEPREFDYFRFDVVGECAPDVVMAALKLRRINAAADAQMFALRDA